MGEVYKARDTRLDRTVAIKILPAELSADPDRRARFEREARAVAALSHPHICTLHDIGTHDGTTYLVMEYLAGESLAQRLTRGPVPVAQALDIAAQIAEALDAAHKHGIIHRDLKPGNVMLTSGGAGRSGVTSAKLLDFGLAKLAAHGERPALAGGASIPTQAAPVTAEGTILGTLQYMAPEQLEGKEADARTDLWALGVILYEMVTGRRAFEGESQVSLIGNIMNAEPAALASLQPLTPPSLERVVTKCLAKHPDDRWDTAHDVADELRWIHDAGAASGTVVGSGRGRSWPALARIGILGAVMALLGAGAVWLFRPTPATPHPVTRSLLSVGPADELNGGVLLGPAPTGGAQTALTWTPDGTALVFVGRRGGEQQLYVRQLDRDEAQPLAGTDNAQVPAVSADGKWVAFWAGGSLKKVRLAGGPVAEIAAGIGPAPFGMTWDVNGNLFFGRGDGRIWAVRPSGELAGITKSQEGEWRQNFPSLLPDAKALLYTARKQETGTLGDEIVAYRLDTGQRKALLRDADDGRYVSSGHIVFLRRGAMYAVAFDAQRLEVRGEPTLLLDGVAQTLLYYAGAGQFAISSQGTLAWIPGSIPVPPNTALVSIDREGRVTSTPVPARPFAPGVRISPDGGRAALIVHGVTGRSLWAYDLSRGTPTALNQEGESGWIAQWSPDGQRLAYRWINKGRSMLAWQLADGTGPPEVLAAGDQLPCSWMPDSRQIMEVTSANIAYTWDFWLAAIDHGQARLQRLTESPKSEHSPELSPDGRWLASAVRVMDRYEVCIQPFPGPGRRVQVSLDGGTSPAWRRDGRELFFLSVPRVAGERRRMMAVDVAPGSPPRLGTPRPLFECERGIAFFSYPMRLYDVAPDGQHFYAVRSPAASSPPPPVTHISLIQNWFEELKAKVPGGRAK